MSYLDTVTCSSGYIDRTTLPETRYSYKIIVDDKYESGLNTIITSRNVFADQGSNGTTHNPNTGIVSHGLLVIVVGIVGVSILNLLKKKDLFKNL